MSRHSGEDHAKPEMLLFVSVNN